MRSLRPGLIAALLPAAVALAACSDSPRPYGERTTPPPSARQAPTEGSAPPGPTTPPGVPQDRTDVNMKK